MRAGLLGAVVAVDGGFEAQWTAGGLRFHDLRHSYATWLVDDGVPPHVVRRVMGHKGRPRRSRRTDNSDRVLDALADPEDEPAPG